MDSGFLLPDQVYPADGEDSDSHPDYVYIESGPVVNDESAD